MRFWRRRRGEDGFNLVVLVMAVTTLNILVAMALPSWSQFIRREKEADLIFRGLQYAEAIRVFQIRNNRMPTRLKELIEVEPRSIRQLWKNPMAEDGAWLLLPIQGQQGQNLQQQGNNQRRNQQNQRNQRNQQNQRNRQQDQQRQGQGQGLQATAIRVIPGDDGAQASMPFMGVSSPEGEEAVKSFMGSQQIQEWQFTVELVSQQRQAPHENFARPVHSAVFWRPFPEGITLPQTQQPGRQGQPIVGGDPTRRPPGQQQNPGLQNQQRNQGGRPE